MAPLIAGLLKIGLPILAGAVQAKGAELVQEKLGVDIAPMLGTSEGQLALKKLEAEREELLLGMAKSVDDRAYQYFEAEVADKNSARQMQIAALGQDDVFAKRFIYWFTGGWSLFGMIFILLTVMYPIPAANIRFVDTAQGFMLATVLGSMFAFFYGSSSGSKEKNSALQMALSKQKDSAA